ncbi:MAG: LdpA C-terminal domain-containing domain [Cyanobacteria bacterium J06634_5]
MRPPKTPLNSLQAGQWFKLICGASYQALPAVRNLSLAYALAGADCIDIAADLAVVKAAKDGLSAAAKIAADDERGAGYTRPWLMVSMSAGEDPHFRKAWFNPAICPTDCPRPCEQICPAAAIDTVGVIPERCYGCGRCIPICPLGLIEARSYPTQLDAIAQPVLSEVQALEIHTQVGHIEAFEVLWQTVQPWTAGLKLISISCPDGPGLIDYLKSLQAIMADSQASFVMWQTDGRPMSGDIGKGTTHAAIRLAQKVLASKIEGYVQLAGGTNQHTALKLSALGLLKPLRGKDSIDLPVMPEFVTGVAYGSYARSLLMPIIEQTLYLEEVPNTLWKAVALARSLVMPLKRVVL